MQLVKLPQREKQGGVPGAAAYTAPAIDAPVDPATMIVTLVREDINDLTYQVS